MRTVYVPFRGSTWFWHLASEDLSFLRLFILNHYGQSRHALFDGIYILTCDQASEQIPVDFDPVTGENE